MQAKVSTSPMVGPCGIATLTLSDALEPIVCNVLLKHANHWSSITSRRILSLKNQSSKIRQHCRLLFLSLTTKHSALLQCEIVM